MREKRVKNEKPDQQMGIDGGKARGRRKRSGSLIRGFASNEKGERE